MGCLAVAAALAIPFHFVGLVVAFDWNGTNRSSPSSVYRRFAGASLSTLMTLLTTSFILKSYSAESLSSLLGLHLEGSASIILCISIHTTLIYLADLVDFIVQFDARLVKDTVFCLDWIRITILAPVTEELVFRGCACRLLSLSFGDSAATWLAPSLFAICHLNLTIDDRRRGIPFSDSFKSRLGQVVYTYAFGVYAAFLFFRTGRILAPIVCHAICNNFGLPIVLYLSSVQPSAYRYLLLLLSFVGLASFISAYSLLTNPEIFKIGA